MDETKWLRTHHGLKYALSQQVYDDIESRNDKELWRRIDERIEAASAICSFLSLLSFLILSLLTSVGWNVYTGIGVGVFVLGLPLSRLPGMVSFSPFNKLLCGYYNIFIRIFLPHLIVIAAGIIEGHWYAGLIYAGATFIFDLLLKATINCYDARKPFNVIVAAQELKR